MGFVGDAIGGLGNMASNLTGIGSDNGMNYRADGTSIIMPVSADQLATSQDVAQNSVNQLRNYTNTLGASLPGYLSNQDSLYSQQQGLANQLQGVASGTGPNPALAQLNNTTSQNIASQNAMMAGQRGSGSNVGMIARQAGQLGANLQQQAVGQGAALAAQQQIAGMTALGSQQNNMAALNNSQLSNYTNSLNSYATNAQAQQAQTIGALNNYNAQRVNMQGNINSSNAGVSSQMANIQGNSISNLGGAAGAAMLALAHGGMVPRGYADGGEVATTSEGPRSFYAKLLANNTQAAPLNPNNTAPLSVGGGPTAQASANMGDQFTKLFKQWGAPSALPAEAGLGGMGAGDLVGGAAFASKGAFIQGSAPVKGDSVANDTVPAMLSPKEIVIPRSITMGKNPGEAAKRFVEAQLKKNGMKK